MGGVAGADDGAFGSVAWGWAVAVVGRVSKGARAMKTIAVSARLGKRCLVMQWVW